MTQHVPHKMLSYMLIHGPNAQLHAYARQVDECKALPAVVYTVEGPSIDTIGTGCVDLVASTVAVALVQRHNLKLKAKFETAS